MLAQVCLMIYLMINLMILDDLPASLSWSPLNSTRFLFATIVVCCSRPLRCVYVEEHRRRAVATAHVSVDRSVSAEILHGNPELQRLVTSMILFRSYAHIPANELRVGIRGRRRREGV